MEMEKSVIEGYLLCPPQGILGHLKRTWQKKYCQLFKSSKYGVKRLEIWDNKDDIISQQTSPKIITLEECIKISPYNQPKVFTIFTKANTCYFGCLTEAETHEWISILQQVAFNDDSSNQIIEEENELYCTTGDDIFSVQLVETAASKRCRLHAKNYILIISDIHMKLMDGDTVLFTWPFRYIRKYGYRDGTFTFEAGRNCESGEGLFKLEHNNQQEIFKCISSKMKSMKKLLKKHEDCGQRSVTGGLELSTMQYHDVLSMEAGSRSPLSVTQNLHLPNFIDDLTNSIPNSSKPSILSTNSSAFSMESVSLIHPPPPIIKPRPVKPPRKHFLNETSRKMFDLEQSEAMSDEKRYEIVNYGSSPELSYKNNISDSEKHPYDLIEIRSDAWKTYGIDTVHDDENYRIDGSNSNSKKYREKNKIENSANGYFESTVDEIIHSYSDSDTNDDVNDSNHHLLKGNQDKIHTNHIDNDKDDQNNNKNEDDEERNNGNICGNFKSFCHIESTSPTSIVYNNLFTSNESTTNYDQLEHIGPSHKVSICNNPGYKVPNVIPSSGAESISSTSNPAMTLAKESYTAWNDYDFVENGLATEVNDAPIYGVIRKKNTTSEPKYEVFNNTEYAIVSKPKRV
ncbi:docking protein 3 [Chelonus insularis]|uniref:docking protein 3 n=1 Tax=Chelonus insularis TaxID=460826 RepID=UPI00158AA49D|nr:docking protein 3 [Chelonus insularis]